MSLRILIVDDEEANLALLEAALGPQGYQIAKAKNGSEALQYLTDNETDLVLLDVMMPIMSGFEVLKVIRKSTKIKTLPVILLTALNGREDRIGGIDAGADDFISKPFDMAELLSRVRTQSGLSVLRRQINEKDKLLGIMDMMKEGSIVTDSNFIIQYINSTAMSMLGITGAGVGFDSFLREKYGFVFNSQAGNGRFVLESADGALHGPLFISASHRRVDKPGGVDSFVFVLKDVTEEYGRNKMKQDFLSMISHKLRTPLTIISGYSKLLVNMTADEKLKDIINAVGRNSTIMEELIKRILYFVEIENTSKPGTADRLYIRQTADRYAALYHKEYVLTTPHDAVNAGYWQILVMEELIGNAFKFCVRDKLMLNAKIDEGMLLVEDDGPGIPAGEFEKAFEPFYQGGRYFTGNAEGAGLGLGLAVVKRLAEANNCSVSMGTGEAGGLKVMIAKKQPEPSLVS